MKKFLLILGIIAIINLVNAQCGYSGTGDWNINSTVNCKDTSITLNGKIIINKGWLNATNVVFTFNNTGLIGLSTHGTSLYKGNFTLKNCTYQSNTPSINTSSSGNSNTWISLGGVLADNDGCHLWANGTTFIGLGMYPLQTLNLQMGVNMIRGKAWFDNCTCKDSVNCYISQSAGDYGNNNSIRVIHDCYWENVSTYPYVFLSGGAGETTFVSIHENRWGANVERLGSLSGGTRIQIHDQSSNSVTTNYGFSQTGSSEFRLYNLLLNGSPTAIELNQGNYDVEIYNVTIYNGGFGCNYGNHNITIHNISILTREGENAHGIMASSVVVGQPNYNIHVYDLSWEANPVGAAYTGAEGFKFHGENSTFENMTLRTKQCGWECGVGIDEYTTYSQAYYAKNVTFQNIKMYDMNVGIRLKNYSDSTFRDISMTNILNYNIKFLGGKNTVNRFINVTHDSVFFDNDQDVFDYYNYLSVNVTGDNVWGIEVYNRTNGLLVTRSTTTGKIEKLEVNEFKQTKLATTLQYPHTIKVTGLVAETDYNVTVDGIYSQTKKTDAGGTITFQENITDNTRMTLTATTDVYPPFITIITPQNTKYAQGAITAEISLDEEGDWCAYSLEGNGNKTMTGAGKSWTALLTELAQIEYDIIFWCNDSLGHMGSSELRYFTVVECLLEGDCGIGQYCSIGDMCMEKKGEGAPCSIDSECVSDECCHGTCRTICPFCGDGFCEGGETCELCPEDCSCQLGGPGGGTGGVGGIVIGANCYDGIRNQGEQGIDCGGPCKACPSCMDGILNQGETGIDCGGPCGECAPGAAAASCYDKIKNQGEQGIDCGGPCKACSTGKILEEKFMIGVNHPSQIEAGDQYTVGVTVENTGDTRLGDLNVKVGSQIKTVDLDLTEKKTIDFHLTAPRDEGEYTIRVEAYNGTLRGEQQTKIQVKPTPLTLRAITVDNITYIITQTNYTEATIELIVTREGKTVYVDYISEEEHITQIQAGNYQIQANLKIEGKTLKTKEITPTTEKETIPTDITLILTIPILIINIALLGKITKKIIRR